MIYSVISIINNNDYFVLTLSNMCMYIRFKVYNACAFIVDTYKI